MSNIDKQALRRLATDAHEMGIIKRYTKGIDANKRFVAAATPLVVRTLLDELETKEEQRANWFQMAQKLGEDLDAAEKRIAELETVRGDLRKTMAAIHNTIRMDGVNTSLASIMGIAKRAYDESSAAAGIGKGE
ncbi:TPA: hypothetical protein JAN03_01075 [Citrobacter freundii]|nr:hypothetical protein [Citrobacter freundii]